MIASYFNDRQLVILVTAVLVEKLGGRITITQKDIDRVAFNRLMEDVDPQNGQITLRIERRSQQ